MDLSFPISGKQTARPSRQEGIHHGVSCLFVCLVGWLVPCIVSCFELYMLVLVQIESLGSVASIEPSAFDCDNG
jgi:hypothetical protein